MKRWMMIPCALLCACSVALAQPPVVINEFVYDDIGDDDREFIELYNPNNFPVDISGWSLESGDQLTGDNNPDFVFPEGTVIPANGYLVVGDPFVPNVSLTVSQATVSFWENDNEWTILRDANGAVVDAVAYEVGRAPDLSTWVPSDLLSQIGGGIWGELQSNESGGANDNTYMTWSRYSDGYDTNNNGRDFGMMRPTPGAANASDPIPTDCENFNSRSVGSIVPGFTGSWRGARVIDPTVAGASGGNDPSNPNPNAISASPDGGNAMIAWDWSGGGDVITSDFLFTNGAGFDTYIYIETTPLPAGGTVEHESWAIGLMGTCDTFYRPIPYTNPPIPSAFPAGPGITGVAWVYHRREDTNEVTLRLVNAGDGGNSLSDWVEFGAPINLTEEPSGWYRLTLEVSADGNVVGKLYLSEGFVLERNGTTAPNLVGQMYIGYREFIVNNALCRPPTLDNLCIYVPTGCDRSNGDVNCDGCVDDADLLQVLFAFGGSDAESDVNNDGVVDDADLLIVLFNFGSGC